jgi:LytS/YehU family sensor histidine kinase
LDQRIPGQSPGASPVSPISVHFVNNVLAAAASYIEEDPDTARDVLAELGAFLSHRLRGPREVSPAEEIEHIGVYLRLEQARFPGRIDVELPPVNELPSTPVGAGEIQAPLAEALGRWMGQYTGQVRVALRAREDALDLQLDRPDAPGEAGERLRIPWSMSPAGRVA